MSSVYYFNLHLKYKKEVNKYNKQIEYLQKIKRSLDSDFYDDQSSVNKELDGLKTDIRDSIKHYQPYSQISEDCELYKEKATSADRELCEADNALDNEIAMLTRKRDEAQANADAAYAKYLSELQREREEAERMANALNSI